MIGNCRAHPHVAHIATSPGGRGAAGGSRKSYLTLLRERAVAMRVGKVPLIWVASPKIQYPLSVHVMTALMSKDAISRSPSPRKATPRKEG